MFDEFRDYLKSRVQDDIRVHRKRMPCDEYGKTYRVGEHWQIDVATRYSEETQVDTLIHEFAHVVGRTNYHGKAFGIAYAEVYGMWIAWCKEQDER